MDVKKKSSIFANSVIVSYGLIETLKYVKIIPEMPANILGCFLGALSIVYIVVRHGVNRQWRIILFVSIYEVFGFVSCIYNGNMDIQELFWIVFFMGIALLLLSEDISNKAAAFPVYLYCAVLAYYLFTRGSIYEINTSESRNYVSVYLLSFYSIYLIARERNNEKSIPWTALICAATISCLSLGRGGILTFSFLVCLSAVYSMGKIRKKWRFCKSGVFLVLMTVMVICFFWEPLYHFLSVGLRAAVSFFVQRGLRSNARLGIWEDYGKQILSSPVHLLVAPKIGGTEWLSIYSSNLHNSYLMLYARYGLLVFLIVLFRIIASLKWYIKEKKWMICIVFVGILLRCFTDVICFNGVMDISLYYLMFSPFYNKISMGRHPEQIL